MSEEAKAVVVGSLEQDHAGVRPALAIDRGQRHRFGHRVDRRGLIEPGQELHDRVIIQFVAVKTGNVAARGIGSGRLIGAHRVRL